MTSRATWSGSRVGTSGRCRRSASKPLKPFFGYRNLPYTKRLVGEVAVEIDGWSFDVKAGCVGKKARDVDLGLGFLKQDYRLLQSVEHAVLPHDLGPETIERHDGESASFDELGDSVALARARFQSRGGDSYVVVWREEDAG